MFLAILIVLNSAISPLLVVEEDEKENATESVGTDLEDEERSFEEILQAHPCDPEAIEGLHGIAKQWAHERENYDRAVQLYEKLLECEPDNVQFLYELGSLFLYQKEFRQGEALLRQALSVDPNFYLAEMALGNAERWQGRLDEALTAYKRALRIKSCAKEPVEQIRSLAKEWEDLGNYRKSVLAYKTIASCEDGGEIAYELGMLYARGEQYEQAIPYLEKAAKSPKYNIDVIFELGKIYYYKGENAVAGQYLLELLILKPCDPDVSRYLRWVARSEMAAEQYEEALEIYEVLSLCEPTDRTLLNNRGKLLTILGKEESVEQMLDLMGKVEPKFRNAQRAIWTGDLEGARQTFEAYLADNPCDDIALDGLEEIALEYEKNAEDWDTSIAIWQQVLGCRPDDPEVLLHLGKIYMWKEEFDRAEKYLKQAYEAGHEFYLAELYLSNVYIRQERFEEADAIIARYPGEHHARVNKGLSHYQKKEYRKAEKVFAEIVGETKGDRDTRMWYGRSLAKQMRFDEAKRQYELAMMGTPENEILWRELWNTKYFTNPLFLYDIRYVEAKEDDPELEAPVVKNYYFNQSFDLYLPITNQFRLDLQASYGFEKENDIFDPVGHNYKVDVTQFRLTERYRVGDEWSLNFFENIRIGDGRQHEVNFPFANRVIFEPGGSLIYRGEDSSFATTVFYDSFVTKNFARGQSVFIKTKNVEAQISHEFDFHPIRPRIRGLAANRYYQDRVNNKRRTYSIWVVVGPPEYTNLIDIYYRFDWRAFDKLTTNYWSYLRQYRHHVGIEINKTWGYNTYFNFTYEYEWQQTHQQLRPIGNFLFISPLQKLQGQRVETLISRRLGDTFSMEISGSYFRSTLVYRAWSLRSRLVYQF